MYKAEETGWGRGGIYRKGKILIANRDRIVEQSRLTDLNKHSDRGPVPKYRVNKQKRENNRRRTRGR
jgi:hypothetical protein